MADERSRVEATHALSDALGPRAAAALVECIPPYGWHEIATKADLVGLEERLWLRLDARLHAEANRQIRWTVASLFAAIAALGGAGAAIASFLR